MQLAPSLRDNEGRQILSVRASAAGRSSSDAVAALDRGVSTRRLSAAAAATRITYTPAWKLYKV